MLNQPVTIPLGMFTISIVCLVLGAYLAVVLWTRHYVKQELAKITAQPDKKTMPVLGMSNERFVEYLNALLNRPADSRPEDEYSKQLGMVMGILLIRRGWSISDLSVKIQMDSGMLTTLLAGIEPFSHLSRDYVETIAKALGLSLEELCKLAGFSPTHLH